MPLMVLSAPRYLSLPTGDITAAVPQPNTSVISPLSIFAMISSMARRSSATSNPSVGASCSTESRVTPARMLPLNSGVTMRRPPWTKQIFIAPTSST